MSNTHRVEVTRLAAGECEVSLLAACVASVLACGGSVAAGAATGAAGGGTAGNGPQKGKMPGGKPGNMPGGTGQETRVKQPYNTG